MNLEIIWNSIAPFVGAFIGLGGGGIIIYIVVRLLVDKVFKRNKILLDKVYSPDSMSQSIADKLVGKALNIDLTAMTETALQSVSDALASRVDKIDKLVNDFKPILIAIAKANARLKAVSDDPEATAEMTACIQALESTYTPVKPKEAVTVKLEPMAVTKPRLRLKTGIVNSLEE